MDEECESSERPSCLALSSSSVTAQPSTSSVASVNFGYPPSCSSPSSSHGALDSGTNTPNRTHPFTDYQTRRPSSWIAENEDDDLECAETEIINRERRARSDAWLDDQAVSVPPSPTILYESSVSPFAATRLHRESSSYMSSSSPSITRASLVASSPSVSLDKGYGRSRAMSSASNIEVGSIISPAGSRPASPLTSGAHIVHGRKSTLPAMALGLPNSESPPPHRVMRIPVRRLNDIRRESSVRQMIDGDISDERLIKVGSHVQSKLNQLLVDSTPIDRKRTTSLTEPISILTGMPLCSASSSPSPPIRVSISGETSVKQCYSPLTQQVVRSNIAFSPSASPAPSPTRRSLRSISPIAVRNLPHFGLGNAMSAKRQVTKRKMTDGSIDGKAPLTPKRLHLLAESVSYPNASTPPLDGQSDSDASNTPSFALPPSKRASIALSTSLPSNPDSDLSNQSTMDSVNTFDGITANTSSGSSSFVGSPGVGLASPLTTGGRSAARGEEEDDQMQES